MRDAKRRIETVLRQAFPNNEIAPRHFGELLVEYAESGVGPPNLVNEIETGGERALWSFAWEAMLCRHLRTQGYEPKARRNVPAPGLQNRACRQNHLDRSGCAGA